MKYISFYMLITIRQTWIQKGVFKVFQMIWNQLVELCGLKLDVSFSSNSLLYS